MTQAVAYSNFRANLKTYMRRVNEDADTLLVTNADPEDNVVVMSADDYDSLMETLRVYQNPYLSDKVMRGMAQVRQGQTMAPDAWADYLYWQSQDRRTLKRVNTLIRDMQRTPFEGIGKPEPLKWGLSGAWSRRIDSANRIIYTVADDRLCILSAKDHY